MTTHDLPELSLDESAAVQGGFGLRTMYRETVKGVTAGVGGWQLANQMYGTPEHGASWSEKWRAMRAVKGYLDSSDKLPSCTELVTHTREDLP